MDIEIMINKDIWLHKAQRLHIGQSVRVRHGRESRLNLNIHNDTDRWWCYCHSCKDGGTVMKEHVLLKPIDKAENDNPVLPNDLLLAQPSEYGEIVGRYLASKGMAYPYLPDLYVSTKSKRILLQDDKQNWHGRDMTGKSNYKWMNYQKARFVGTPSKITVVTEDLFSMYKMRYALNGWALSVTCSLGASIGHAAAKELYQCEQLVYAYDADKAGDDGFKQGSKAMKVYVPRQFRFRPPEGLDPKDMQCEDIRNLMEEVLPWRLR